MGRTRWQEIIYLVKQGSIDRQKKVGTFRLTGNHTFWVIMPQWQTKKGGEGRHLLRSNVTFRSLRSHSQVALVVKNPPANAEDIRDAASIPR